MDPTVTLAQLRKVTKKFHDEFDGDKPDTDKLVEYGNKLADLFHGLDHWMTGGGFSPWSK